MDFNRFIFIFFFFSCLSFGGDFTLNSCDDLFSLENNYNSNVKLTADLDCTNFILENPIHFNGNLDGQGHTIFGLSINSKSHYAGLFAQLIGAKISNLVLSDFSLILSSSSQKYHAGLLAGKISSTEINNLSIIGGVIDYSDAYYNPKSLSAVGLVSGIVEGSKFDELFIKDSSVTVPDGVRRIGLGFGETSYTGFFHTRMNDVSLSVTNSQASYKSYVGGFVGYAMTGTNIYSLRLKGVEIDISSPVDISAVGLVVGSTLNEVSLDKVIVGKGSMYSFDNNYKNISRIGSIAGNISSITTVNCFSISKRALNSGLAVVGGKFDVTSNCL